LMLDEPALRTRIASLDLRIAVVRRHRDSN
jgi:hypothetical protein